MNDLFQGPDRKLRCHWCGTAPEFLSYHDEEWGFPVDDDIRLFEKICLEGFQAGLSWRTILNKRQRFREVFRGFDFHQVADFRESDVIRLLADSGIVRHRGKIEATINNARKARELVERQGSLAAFFWHYEPDPVAAAPKEEVSTSPESEAISRELKKRGWRFVGPTTIYAFMQAMGLVNDHHADCVIRARVTQARREFQSPG